MIVNSIQRIFDFVKTDFRMKLYRTLEDPKTLKQYITCEVYTYKGHVNKMPEKGHNIDKKI